MLLYILIVLCCWCCYVGLGDEPLLVGTRKHLFSYVRVHDSVVPGARPGRRRVLCECCSRRRRVPAGGRRAADRASVCQSWTPETASKTSPAFHDTSQHGTGQWTHRIHCLDAQAGITQNSTYGTIALKGAYEFQLQYTNMLYQNSLLTGCADQRMRVVLYHIRYETIHWRALKRCRSGRTSFI